MGMVPGARRTQARDDLPRREPELPVDDRARKDAPAFIYIKYRMTKVKEPCLQAIHLSARKSIDCADDKVEPLR
jgi:hypothetical protein